ncbi:small integral membrane protein 32 isoform X1 [Tamandua tetradactyla]|uniref:small integral membrane protein 32 isoform X1 n=1 Tax=Tamandua tetradactyla TaxID=48850 RepID=UPI004053AC15
MRLVAVPVSQSGEEKAVMCDQAGGSRCCVLSRPHWFTDAPWGQPPPVPPRAWDLRALGAASDLSLLPESGAQQPEPVGTASARIGRLDRHWQDCPESQQRRRRRRTRRTPRPPPPVDSASGRWGGGTPLCGRAHLSSPLQPRGARAGDPSRGRPARGEDKTLRKPEGRGRGAVQPGALQPAAPRER